ncbi:MAG: hypothetical protein J1E36_00295 [Eubacterium sp.]|nr:hypothetical protein [Eubacterium sp.]
MKIKITVILLCAVIILGAGMSVAYYNTKSFGFDENAKVVHYDDEKISFMDFDIYYKDVTGFIDRVSEIIPEKSRTVFI